MFYAFCYGFILSMGASIKLGSKVLFVIPYPEFIQYILKIFRATGRFVWVPCYLIYFACMYIVYKYTNKNVAKVIISLCLIIQIVDFYPSMINKFEYDDGKYNIDETSWNIVLEGKKHIALFNYAKGSFEEKITKIFKLSNIAYENDCTMNTFYFARKIINLDETVQKQLEDVREGRLENDYLYVSSQDDDLGTWWNENLYCYNIDGYKVITDKEYKELEKLIEVKS